MTERENSRATGQRKSVDPAGPDDYQGPSIRIGGLEIDEHIERDRGAILVSHAPVLNISNEGKAFRVRTRRGEMRAREVVVGTNGYTDRVVPYLHRRVVPVTAYVATTEPLPEGMAKP